uniref:Uncharacterized protein n=1 Tax=Arundo donax TaxID=35708 RepID=A0A0A9FBL8_ARUDO
MHNSHTTLWSKSIVCASSIGSSCYMLHSHLHHYYHDMSNMNLKPSFEVDPCGVVVC